MQLGSSVTENVFNLQLIRNTRIYEQIINICIYMFSISYATYLITLLFYIRIIYLYTHMFLY